MSLKPFVAVFCYDPRDPTQDLDDHTTWKRSTNGILIAATMLHTSRDDFLVSWDKVAALADMSEEPEIYTSVAHPTATLAETNTLLQAVLAKRRPNLA